MFSKHLVRAGALVALAGLALAAALPAQASTGTGWRIFARFSTHGGQVSLNNVAAISAKDAWAAGTTLHHNTFGPIVMHWNGKSWRHVKLPGAVRSALDTAKTQNVGVKASGSTDV